MDFFKLARTQGMLLCPGDNAPQKLLLIVLYLNRTNLGVTFLTHLCALRLCFCMPSVEAYLEA